MGCRPAGRRRLVLHRRRRASPVSATAVASPVPRCSACSTNSISSDAGACSTSVLVTHSAAVAHDDHDAGDLQLGQRVEDVKDHRAAAQLVQRLRPVRAHAGALAGGKDHGGEWSARHRPILTPRATRRAASCGTSAASAGPAVLCGQCPPPTTTNSGCSTRTREEFGIAYDGPRRSCAASESRSRAGARPQRAGVGHRRSRAGLLPRRGAERAHLGHRRAGAGRSPGGDRPARPRPLRRRRERGRCPSTTTPRDLAVAVRALAPRQGGHRHVARGHERDRPQRGGSPSSSAPWCSWTSRRG